MTGLALLSLLLAAGEVRLPFSDPAWELGGDARVETLDGREALRIDTGTALRRDVSFQDGTLDFELRLSRRRSFVYVTFRMQDEKEYEEFYLRAHKSDLPDAVQYAPVYQGQSAWQLYHGPGGSAAFGFEAGTWTRVRLVLQGPRAALFVGDMSRPALLVPRLAREPRPGFIGLRSFMPPGTPGEGHAAWFAGVVARPGEAPVDLAALAPSPPPVPSGVVRAWALSGTLPRPADEATPPAVAQWRRVEARADGLVELHRHVTVPAGQREATAAARIQVRSAGARRRVLELGFSDRATVFLNGEPLFRGEGAYSFEGRREGLIGYDQARLHLPLRAGDNELLVVVTDSFGGMGLMGRFPDMEGLAVEAR